MEIQLVRYRHRAWGIDGYLRVNGVKICDTVEHPSRYKPAGLYEVTLHQNPFRRGDGALANKTGEIVVGEYALPGVVIRSGDVYTRLYDRLKKEWKRNHEVWLRVV